MRIEEAAHTVNAASPMSVALSQLRRKDVYAIALHPGTTATDLSAPFQKNVVPEKLFTAEYSAGAMLDVLDGLGTDEADVDAVEEAEVTDGGDHAEQQREDGAALRQHRVEVRPVLRDANPHRR